MKPETVENNHFAKKDKEKQRPGLQVSPSASLKCIRIECFSGKRHDLAEIRLFLELTRKHSPYLACCSDCEPLTLQQLLQLGNDDESEANLGQILGVSLGYTETQGLPVRCRGLVGGGVKRCHCATKLAFYLYFGYLLFCTKKALWKAWWKATFKAKPKFKILVSLWSPSEPDRSTAALPSQAVTFKQVRAGLLVNAALLYNQAFRSIMGGLEWLWSHLAHTEIVLRFCLKASISRFTSSLFHAPCSEAHDSAMRLSKHSCRCIFPVFATLARKGRPALMLNARPSVLACPFACLKCPLLGLVAVCLPLSRRKRPWKLVQSTSSLPFCRHR
eukprot:1002028-Pelagomonas_calceolata.AAC.11